MSHGYTISLLLFFVLPFLFVARQIPRLVEPRPFVWSIATISVIGWAWSFFLSYKSWWIFPDYHVVGINPIPYVPLEEFVIYPIGGAFSIYLYLAGSRGLSARSRPWLVGSFLTGVTALFIAVAVLAKQPSPYLHSQLFVFNTLCLLLAPLIISSMKLRGLLVAVGVLGAIGFVWDHLAFSFDWWIYAAVTGIRLGRVPIEDVNFYLMAPTAAISIYLAFRRLFSNLPARPSQVTP
jgi:lycopene cyclase domain-containing protein